MYIKIVKRTTYHSYCLAVIKKIQTKKPCSFNTWTLCTLVTYLNLFQWSNNVYIRLSIWVNSKNDIFSGLTSNDTSPDLSFLNISLTVSQTISLTYGNSNKNMIISQSQSRMSWNLSYISSSVIVASVKKWYMYYH